MKIPETIGELYQMSSKIKKKIGRPQKYNQETTFRCFRIPNSLDKKITRMASDKKISMNEVIVNALDNFFYGEK